MWIDIIKFLLEILKITENENKEKKEKLSKLFAEISDLINSVVYDLQNDIYPHFSCSMMHHLTDKLFDQTNDILSDEEKNKYYSLLKECSNLEKKFNYREESSVITDMIDAAAQFKVLSLTFNI